MVDMDRIRRKYTDITDSIVNVMIEEMHEQLAGEFSIYEPHEECADTSDYEDLQVWITFRRFDWNDSNDNKVVLFPEEFNLEEIGKKLKLKAISKILKGCADRVWLTDTLVKVSMSLDVHEYMENFSFDDIDNIVTTLGYTVDETIISELNYNIESPESFAYDSELLREAIKYTDEEKGEDIEESTWVCNGCHHHCKVKEIGYSSRFVPIGCIFGVVSEDEIKDGYELNWSRE